MNQSTNSKVCNVCGMEKLLKDFHFHKGCIDGRASTCKLCRCASNRIQKEHKHYADSFRSRLLAGWKRS